jgi:hypothetical protein
MERGLFRLQPHPAVYELDASILERGAHSLDIGRARHAVLGFIVPNRSGWHDRGAGKIVQRHANEPASSAALSGGHNLGEAPLIRLAIRAASFESGSELITASAIRSRSA